MRIGRFIEVTEVEGPGIRAAIWVQGCSIRCPRCCNPEFFDPMGGLDIHPYDLALRVSTLRIEGVTILGGEPLDQPDEILLFLSHLKRLCNHGVFLFTGYSWEKIRSDPLPQKGAAEGKRSSKGAEILDTERSVREKIIGRCDLVKAGPYVHGESPDNRRWIGSKNQTVHFITDRYASLRRQWEAPKNEIEIHFDGNGITINGTPFDESLFKHQSTKPGKKLNL